MDALTSPRVSYNPDALIHAHHALMRGIADAKNIPPRLSNPITANTMIDLQTYMANMRDLFQQWADVTGREVSQHAPEVHPNGLWNHFCDGFGDFEGGLIQAESEYRNGRGV